MVYIRLSNSVNAVAHACYDYRTPGKKDDVSFAVTKIDEERGVEQYESLLRAGGLRGLLKSRRFEWYFFCYGMQYVRVLMLFIVLCLATGLTGFFKNYSGMQNLEYLYLPNSIREHIKERPISEDTRALSIR